MADPKAVAGMARFGIRSPVAFGVSAPRLRALAREIGKSHVLALELWQTGIFDARILAGLVDEPARVTENQLERWVKDFDSWAVCDGSCNSLFRKTEFAWRKMREWCRREEEFVKRAGLVMMAVLAVHDKKAADTEFEKLLPVIKRKSDDDRLYVRKAVNWALRQVGKRNLALNRAAVATAETIKQSGTRSGRWIAADALRELRSEAVQKRLSRKGRARKRR